MRTFINYVLPDGDRPRDDGRFDLTDTGAPLPSVGQEIRIDNESVYTVDRVDWSVFSAVPAARHGVGAVHIDVVLVRSRRAGKRRRR